MFELSPQRTNLIAGAVVSFVGLGAAILGQSYGIGSLRAAGPGFFPVVVGVVLILVGMSIAMSSPDTEDDTDSEGPLVDWRGAACIFGGVLSFILLGSYLGLVPATAACVLISAFGDRTATLKGSLLLTLGVTVFGIALFSFGLKLPFPLLRW